MPSLKLSLVVAVATNGVIGRDNKLLWRLKTDLKRFRSLTIGKPIIMGRKTFDSIGRPLPGRRTIIVSRDATLGVPDVIVAHSLPEAIVHGEALSREMGVDEITIAGGGTIYEQAMPMATHIYVTEVDLNPEGDSFFPSIDHSKFKQVSRKAYPAGGDDEAPFAFVDYVRR